MRAPNLRLDANDNWEDETSIEDEAVPTQVSSAANPLSPDFPAVDTYGRYEILGRLAVGGMAEVFLARDVGPHDTIRHVAIKRILPQIADDETFVEMFLDEARLAVQLNHPTICHIYDFGQLEDTYFIAMEWVNGIPLGKLIKEAKDSGGIPAAVACRIIAQIAEALNYAHQERDGVGRPMNIVHRDVSPQNIMIRYDGVVKLLDFGIAKAATQSSVTEAGVVKGKFSYMSPEQCLGRPLDARSDIFSLGACLFEALTGKSPFRRNSDLDTMRAIVHEPSQSVRILRPDVPETLDIIIRKAIAKDPSARFQTAGDCYVALERFLSAQNEFIRAMHLSQYIERLLPGAANKGPLSTGSTPSARALALESGSRPSAADGAPVQQDRGGTDALTNRKDDAGSRKDPAEPATLDVHLPSARELAVSLGGPSDLIPITEDDDDPTIADMDAEALMQSLEMSTTNPHSRELPGFSSSDLITVDIAGEDGPTSPGRDVDVPVSDFAIHEADTRLGQGLTPEAVALPPPGMRSRRLPILIPIIAAVLAGVVVGVVVAVTGGDDDVDTAGPGMAADPSFAAGSGEEGAPLVVESVGAGGETAAGEDTAGEDTAGEDTAGEDSAEGTATDEGSDAEDVAIGEGTPGDEGEGAVEGATDEGTEAAAGAGSEAGAEPAPTGSLLVETVPTGASVRVAGRRLTTPETLDDLAPGTYEVFATRAGYERWSDRIHIEAGETTTVRAVLRRSRARATPRETGQLSLATQPSSARVFIGNRLIGRTPLRAVQVPAGALRLRIVGPDGQAVIRSVRVGAGEHKRAFFPLGAQ